MLAPDAQGQGLGTEAVRAAHEWFDRVIAGPLVAIVTNDNKSSRRLADYLGYRVMRSVAREDEQLCYCVGTGRRGHAEQELAIFKGAKTVQGMPNSGICVGCDTICYTDSTHVLRREVLAHDTISDN